MLFSRTWLKRDMSAAVCLLRIVLTIILVRSVFSSAIARTNAVPVLMRHSIHPSCGLGGVFRTWLKRRMSTSVRIILDCVDNTLCWQVAPTLFSWRLAPATFSWKVVPTIWCCSSERDWNVVYLQPFACFWIVLTMFGYVLFAARPQPGQRPFPF